MKLFQQMLVATASLGIIAPIAAQASDLINLDGMNDYKRSSKKSSSKKRFDHKTFVNQVNEDLAELEVQQNNFEAGSFSDTTTLDGKAAFTVGSFDTDDDAFTGQVLAEYMYQMNLNTSFNGDDNLYVRLKAGNGDSWTEKKNVYNGYLSASKGNTDYLKVDKIWYTRPVGDRNTIWIGPQIENYYMHATTPSIYKNVLKAFSLGGNAAAYGASTSPGAGWAYQADNGFAISSNFTTQDGEDTGGMLSEGGKTSWATQVGYTQPQYAVSAILNMKYEGWVDEYFMTKDGTARPGNGNSTNIGLRGWWRPENTGTATPSISVGFDTSETDESGNSNTTAYFVGLNWQDIINADDRIGIGFGQPQKHEDDTVDPFLYEVYYDYKVNDSVTVTPAIFGGTSKNSVGAEVDNTGYLVTTTFKF
ncbi:porin [Prochlorococcus sp. AH-716-P20]|nr:porin [Prochlorococcus sp. AH-716-P20]